MMRLHAIAIRNLSMKNLKETWISPGFFIAMSCGLISGLLVTSGFVDSIGSSGFETGANPFFRLFTLALSGVFGETLVGKLFSEGPFLTALFLSVLPVLFYLVIGSVYKFGLEKNNGALELIVFGPADGTSCLLAVLIKNLILTTFYILFLLVFFLLTALCNNLVLGDQFFYGWFLVLFISLAVYAGSICIAVITDNPASGITLCLVLFVFFSLLQIASYASIAGGNGQPAGNAFPRLLVLFIAFLKSLAPLLQWFSPLYYWEKGLAVAEYGSPGLYCLNIFFLVLLSAAFLLLAHFILRGKGVRG